jgi:hypothetical protein
MKDLFSALVVAIALLLLLPFLGINTTIIFRMIEWSTKFILPWFGLFWLVKMVKTLDHMSKNNNKKIENDEV